MRNFPYFNSYLNLLNNTRLICLHRQLDSRLTKVAPTRATISTVTAKEPDDIDEPSLRRTILTNVSAGGRATPYTKIELKVHGSYQVKVLITRSTFTKCIIS